MVVAKAVTIISTLDDEPENALFKKALSEKWLPLLTTFNSFDTQIKVYVKKLHRFYTSLPFANDIELSETFRCWKEFI